MQLATALPVLLFLLPLVTAESAFEAFVSRFSKTYASPADRRRAEEAFEVNTARLAAANSAKGRHAGSHSLGLTAFADMSPEAFAEWRGADKTARAAVQALAELEREQASSRSPSSLSPVLPATRLPSSRMLATTGSGVPDAVDWRQSGCIGPVRNEGQCGGSDLLDTIDQVAALDSIQNNATSLQLLSLTELDNCATTGGHCSAPLGAGLKFCASHGIEDVTTYPPQRNDCNINSDKPAVKCGPMASIPSKNETALTAMIAAYGPIICGVDASQFQMYTGGIYSNPSCSDRIDHSMLAVGYGTENGVDYYILRNTWGTAWGEEGYMRLKRNAGNMCGIASYAIYPSTVKRP